MATKDQVYHEQAETLQYLKDAMPEKFPGEPDTVRPEWEDQRIRIEALRAAAQFHGQVYAAMLRQGFEGGKSSDVRANVLHDAEPSAGWRQGSGSYLRRLRVFQTALRQRWICKQRRCSAARLPRCSQSSR